MDRRRFISIAAGAGVGVLLPLAAYRAMMHGTNVGYVNVKAYLKDGPQAALRAITPNDDFYLTSAHGEPGVDAEKWSLVIDGLVDQPLRFNYDEIRKLERYQTTLTLECISNPVGGGLIGNAVWGERRCGRCSIARESSRRPSMLHCMPPRATPPAIPWSAFFIRRISSRGR